MEGRDVKTGIELVVPLCLLLAALAGCAGGPEDDAPAAEAEPARQEVAGESRSARTLPIPGEPLPPDHPPLEGAPAARLAWQIPDDWTVEEPATGMRIAQYRVPGPEGDAECVVFYFGSGQGGDAMANARRWAGQFTQPDGSSSLDRMKVTALDSAAVNVQLVEVTGTYDGGMTMSARPAERREGYMLLGGIALGPDAPWFFKMTGPEATVLAQRDEFAEMMKSIRLDE
jgi:hypothetical protein